MSKENLDEHLTDHEYDGIKELDNPLPNWWLGIFWVTVIFGAVYYYYYEFGGGPSLQQELNQKLATIQSSQSVAEQNTARLSSEDLIALIDDSSAMAAAKAEFTSKCAACHGNEGQGGIGPNLTDNYWIHDKGDAAKMVELIEKGIADKGMPPWKGVITQDNIHNLAAYVKSMSGTNPEGGKEPQGELVE